MKNALRLPPRDWFALGEAWLWLIYFQLVLRFQSFEKLTSKRDQLPVKDRSGFIIGMERSQQLHRLVGVASRLQVFSVTCLVRSLALQALARKRGIHLNLVIGAETSHAGMRAHAWVELNGTPVGEAGDVAMRFSKFIPAGEGVVFH